MSSVKKNTPLTAEEHQKMHTLIAMQMEALGPGPHKSLSTTCFKGKAAYVDGATLRLQALEYLIEQGILTSEEAEKVKVSRSAAAEGTAQINRPKSTPVAPKDERTLNRTNDQKSLDTAKGPAVEDSDWEDLDILTFVYPISVPRKREIKGEQAAKVDLQGADANSGDPIQPLGRGTNLRKYDLDDYLYNVKPLPEFCQMSWGLSPSSTSKPSPRCALNTLTDLNPGKERKVEGKKPVEEDYDSVKVDMTESEAYEMVEKEEAEMAGWEEL
ncbi:MAG: hypothetical protein Q9161_007533 [Pseudevernia consocians]